MPASTFEEILEVKKFNPYHGTDGRFSSASNYASFTYSPGKSKAHDMAIAREKERMSGIMPSEAQNKTLKSIESRTRNLKKEQYRVVDRDGNVVMEKQGGAHSVSYTIGEARDNIPGNITIHNHPSGGTFSTADLSDIGHGATEIRAASPEGTYVLRNLNYRTKWNANTKTWYEMRDDLEAASSSFKTDRQLKKEVRKPFDEQLKPMADKWEQRRAAGASQEELKSIGDEYLKACDNMRPQIEKATHAAYVKQYDDWYRANASKYGMEYEFIPVKTRTKKSYSEEIEYLEKSDGEIILDRKIQEDVEEMTNAIMEELKGQIPHEEDSLKSFNVYKTDNDKRLVFGWASISITVDGQQLEDRQKDMIDPEDLEEAAYEYVLNFRDTGEEHIPTMRKKGKLVESCVLTAEKQKAMGIPEGTLPVGWWIGFKIEDDDAWERVKNGTYRMFSIEGKANREPVEKSANTEETMKKAIDRFDYIVEVAQPQRVAKTFNEMLEIQKYNPYHGSDGRFTSSGGGWTTYTGKPGRSYGSTNTKDALGEKDKVTGKLKDNSLRAYMDKDGKLSQERENVHKQIIDDLLKGKTPVEGQATMTMLGGGPASGKSSVMSTKTDGDPHKVKVDPDMIKEKLPGYKEMAAKTDKAASYYHEESSALAKRFYETALKENLNVIYDGTGDGSTASVEKKINAAKAKGYRVEGKYVSIDTEEAVKRNTARYENAKAKGENPRLVPDDVVRGTHAAVTDISVASASKFDSIEIWDNNGARGQQKMIASGGNGKGLKVVPGEEAAFKNYLAKGTKGEAGFSTLPDGTVIPVE